MYHTRNFLLIISAIALALSSVFIGRALANREMDYSDCASNQNCGNCLQGTVTLGNPCGPSGVWCIFYGNTGTGNGVTFRHCIYSPNGGDQCRTIPLNPPLTTCPQSNFWYCTCWTSTTGDCDITGPCTNACDTTKPTGKKQSLTIDETC